MNSHGRAFLPKQCQMLIRWSLVDDAPAFADVLPTAQNPVPFHRSQMSTVSPTGAEDHGLLKQVWQCSSSFPLTGLDAQSERL